MRDRPAGVAERNLVHALADGWGLSAETLRYAPVGGGSYHWVVTSGPGEQWFVTVDDLDGTLENLAGQGIDPERPPYTVREGGSRLCFVRDPDDYRIELIESGG